MNMTLSRRGDYVMRSAIALARAFDGGSARKVQEVVTQTAVPQTFASQILADLVHAGLATSRAGRAGGYRLSRSPSEISVLEVIESAEGPLEAERCALGEGPCRWEAVCPLHETWSKAIVELRRLLAKTSLADVAARDAEIEAGTYAIPADAHRSSPVTIAVSDRIQIELPEPETHRLLARLAPELDLLAKDVAARIVLDETGSSKRAGQPSQSPGAAITAEASLAPARRRRSAGRSASGSYLLALRAFGLPGSTATALEADMAVVALDAARCELQLEGSWRRSSESGVRFASRDLEQQASRAARTFLRGLARLLEEAPSVVGQPRQTPTPPHAR